MTFHKLTPAVFEKFLTRLEERFGRVLISAVFAYIDAANGGLSKDELEQVMMLDDYVIEDVFERHSMRSPLRAVPKHLMTDLWNEITVVFEEVRKEGVATLSFKDDALEAVARTRYLSDLSLFSRVHSNLADLFSGRYSDGTEKPYDFELLDDNSKPTGKRVRGSAPRRTPKQPLVFDPNSVLGTPARGVRYNTRRLRGETYHLIASCRWNDLIETLCSYPFLRAKIVAVGVADVLADFDALPETEKVPVGQMLFVLQQCQAVLSFDANQLLSQVAGRLLPLLGNNKPPQGCLKRFLDTARTAQLSLAEVALFPMCCCVISNLGVRTIENIRSHDKETHGLAFAKGTKRVFSSGNDKLVKVWKPHCHKPQDTISGPKDWVRALTVSTREEVLAWGGYDALVTLYAPKESKKLHELAGHKGAINGIVITSSARTIVSCSDDCTAIVWDIQDDAPKQSYVLQGHTAAVRDVCLQDNRHAVTASSDGSARIWDIQSGQQVHTFRGHRGGVTACTATFDGTFIFTGGEDSTIRMYRAPTGSPTVVEQADKVFKGHFSPVTCLAHAGKGSKMLLSSSQDGTVRLWDYVSDAGCLATFTAMSAVTRVIYDADTRVCMFSCINGVVGRLKVTSDPSIVADNEDAFAPKWVDGFEAEEDVVVPTAAAQIDEAFGFQRVLSGGSGSELMNKSETLRSDDSVAGFESLLGTPSSSRVASVVESDSSSVKRMSRVSSDSFGLNEKLNSLRQLEQRVAALMAKSETANSSKPAVGSSLARSQSASGKNDQQPDEKQGNGEPATGPTRANGEPTSSRKEANTDNPEQDARPRTDSLSNRRSEASLDSHYGFDAPSRRSSASDINMDEVTEKIREATLARDAIKTKLGPSKEELLVNDTQEMEGRTSPEDRGFKSFSLEELSAEEKQKAFERLVMGDNPDLVSLELEQRGASDEPPSDKASVSKHGDGKKGCCTVL